MPIATHEQYCEMLNKARSGGYAFPAINVTSTSTANAALKAFADMKSDGIIQVSTGGGKFASGQGVNDMALGAISIAQHVHLMAQKYNVLIALHTDHCHPEYVDSFMIPLVEESEKRVARGELPLFNSHMFDGSVLPLNENMKTSVELHTRLAKIGVILEIETGIVGGEEDGVNNEDAPADKLYTSPEEMVEVAKTLRPIGPFMYAATFGNVHGVYKPGNVKLTGTIIIPKAQQATLLRDLQEHVMLTLQEPGCLHFDVSPDASDAELYHVNELFVDQAAFDQHQTNGKARAWGKSSAGLTRKYSTTLI